METNDAVTCQTPESRPATRAPAHAAALRAEQSLFELPANEVNRLQAEWRLAREADGDFGVDFYENLFRLGPAVTTLFPGDMSHQQQRMTDTLGEALRLLMDASSLVLLLRAAGVRHHHYRVRQVHFSMMEDALVCTLSRRLGPAFDVEREKSWRKLFSNMSTIMRHALAGTSR